MFNLILTVSALALVIVLVAATMYFGGGEIFSKGKDEAVAAQAMNEMNQIRSALFAYHAQEGGMPPTLNDLTPTYMAALPSGWGESVPVEIEGLPIESRAIRAGNAERELLICDLINDRMGNEETPLCSDIPNGFMGCCESPAS